MPLPVRNEYQSFNAITANLGGKSSIQDIHKTAQELGANTNLFDNAVNPRSRYPYASLDMILSFSEGDVRLFVHENFPHHSDQDGEELLDRAKLGYFPAIVRGDQFTVRRLPLVTMPVLSHVMRETTAKQITRHFIAPVVQKAFTSLGMIPSRETLSNLTHIEDLGRAPTGDDVLELGPRFIPPYNFVPVRSEDFIKTALENAIDYGMNVAQELTTELPR